MLKVIPHLQFLDQRPLTAEAAKQGCLVSQSSLLRYVVGAQNNGLSQVIFQPTLVYKSNLVRHILLYISNGEAIVTIR